MGERAFRVLTQCFNFRTVRSTKAAYLLRITATIKLLFLLTALGCRYVLNGGGVFCEEGLQFSLSVSRVSNAWPAGRKKPASLSYAALTPILF